MTKRFLPSGQRWQSWSTKSSIRQGTFFRLQKARCSEPPSCFLFTVAKQTHVFSITMILLWSTLTVCVPYYFASLKWLTSELATLWINNICIREIWLQLSTRDTVKQWSEKKSQGVSTAGPGASSGWQSIQGLILCSFKEESGKFWHWH